MKKLMVLCCLALLVGCQSEDLENGMQHPVGSRTLVASIEGQDYADASRTAVDDNGNVTWIDTDKLGVYGATSKNLEYSSTGNGSNVTFTGNMPETDEAQWAYYPYEENASLSEGKLTVTLPDSYEYTGNSNAPMLGKKTGDNKFAFKHLGGLIRFTLGGGIPENAGRFVITSTGENQPIAGQATFEVEGENVTMTISADAKQSVSYDVSAIEDAGEFQHFFVPLPVGSYDKLEVSFYLKNATDPVFTRSVSKLNVARAQMVSMPILDWNTGKQYELNENTKDITDLVEGDGVTVTLVSESSLQLTGAEESQLPQKEEIIWSKPTEELPYGFMGKVTEVTEADGTVTITTESVALDEVFDELLIEETVDLVPTADSRSTSTAIGVEKTYTMPIEIQDEDSAYGINGELNIVSQLRATIHVNKEKSINRMDFSLTFNPNLEAEMAVGASFNEDQEMIPFELKDFNFPPITLGGGVFTINPALQFKLYIAPSGEISFKTDVKYNTTCVAGADYQNGQWQYGINEVNHNSQSPWEMTSTIDMNGSLFLGAGVEFKGKIYNRDDLKIYIEPIIGIELSGDLEIKSDDDNMQESLKDAALTTENVASGKFGIDATVLAEQAEASFDFKEKRWGEKQLYVLPMFENLAAQVKTMNFGSRSSTDSFEATITMTAVRELLFNYVSISTTIINEQQEKDTQTADYINYEVVGDDNPSQNFSMKFEYLDPESSYRGYPIVYNPTLEKTIELSEEYVSFHSPAMGLRDQLIALYNAAGGENWTNKENWLSDLPIETWEGVSENNNEYTIDLSSNNLTGTFVLNDPSVVQINIDFNPGLTSVNVAECTSLKTLYYDKDVVTSLDVSSCNTLLTEGNWDINEVETTGTSSVLTSLVAKDLHSVTSFNNMDTNWDLLDLSGCENLESLGNSASEATHIGTLNLSDCKLMTNQSLNNLAFTVDVLNISGCCSITSTWNQVKKELHAAGNKSLKLVGFSIEDGYTGLCDVSGCESLEKLYIYGSYSTLNLNGCTKLSYLSTGRDTYFTADVSIFPQLETLECMINTPIDLSKNTDLKYLKLSHGTSTTQLDLTDSSNLEELILGTDGYSEGVSLESLILPANGSLKKIEAYHVSLPSLDFSQCYALESVTLSQSTISESMDWDISSLKNLTKINISGEYNIKSLNAKGNVGLTNISVSGNQTPATIDIGGCTNLATFSCNNVNGTLDVHDCTNLSKLSCSGSSLSALNISGLKYLTSISLSKSQLTSLDLSGFSTLENIGCYYNDNLTALNLTGCTNVKELMCHENPLLKDLTLMESAPLTTRVSFSNTLVSHEIPDWFPLTNFTYERRYTDYKQVLDSSTGKYVYTCTDKGYGWWFPGEPESGKHSR